MAGKPTPNPRAEKLQARLVTILAGAARAKVSYSIDPRILEAGDIVAEHRQQSRRTVFRTTATADVLDEAAMLLGPGDMRSAGFARLAPIIRRRVKAARKDLV